MKQTCYVFDDSGRLIQVDGPFLTEREYQVFRELRHALPTKAVCETAGCSKNRFDQVVRSLMVKMRAPTRAALIHMAINTFAQNRGRRRSSNPDVQSAERGRQQWSARSQ